MPLAGVRERKPSVEPELLANVESPAETNVDGGAGETPEWFENLPSFEEATSRLRFPASVEVKPPHAEQDTMPSAPRPSVPSPVSPSPSPQIARKPAAPESATPHPRRMRVYTQVEEFTSGSQPPPISLQDLRRVHVGEPAVQRLPAEDTELRDATSVAEPPQPAAGLAGERGALASRPPAVQRLPAEDTEPRDATSVAEPPQPAAVLAGERGTSASTSL
ncbi:MAG TPA: hypothetical protein G4N98_09735, partial [Thermoflexia bacterium]|nr:hypothetical protein [Thermoflexia bacterium]